MFDNLSLPTILITYVALLASLTVHEACHASMAYWLEDDTARRLGRMSLNPLAHIDPIGTVLMPLIGMTTGWRVLGWAKPVPVDARSLTRRFTMRTGMAMVAGAGPGSNFLLSLLFIPVLAVCIRFMAPDVPGLRMDVFEAASIRYVPYEGFLRSGMFSNNQSMLLVFLGRMVAVNIGLAIFNLLPVGPLDGASIMRGFLPVRLLPAFDRAQPTITIVLFVMFLVGFLKYILWPFFWVAETYYIAPFARLLLGA